MDKVSIVMPAYNEEKRIGKTLEAFSNYFDGLSKEKKLDYEINIIINNTRDKTEEIVKGFAKKDKRIRYLNFKEGGKGFAVRAGFKDALKRNNDLIGFVDADLATSPEEYWKLIRAVNKHDGVIASRYIRGSVIEPKPTMPRLLAKWMFNVLVRTLLLMPIRDTQCGAKVFTRKTVENSLPGWAMSKWAFDVDLLYAIRKKGFKVKEFPTRWSDKEYAKINFWRAGPWMALGVIRLRLLNSPAKMFIRVYDNLLSRILKVR